MWTRYELKENAKANLFCDGWRPFWTGVLVVLVDVIISLAAISVVNMPFSLPALIRRLQEYGIRSDAVSLGSLSATAQVAEWVLDVVVSIFVSYPLAVGVQRYFLNNRHRKGQFEDLFYAFQGKRYLPVLASVAWWVLFLTLWRLLREAPDFLLKQTVFAHVGSGDLALLMLAGLWNLCALALLIPFIVKSIAYSMTGFILCDNPKIGFRRALRLSRQMTDGEKGRIFVLYLSFIGWFLLGLLCLVVGMLGSAAYLEATRAELYVRLRDQALRAGKCSYEELHFLPPER